MYTAPGPQRRVLQRCALLAILALLAPQAAHSADQLVLGQQGGTQLSAFINTYSAGRPFIAGGDFKLHTDSEPDSTQFQRLLMETGATDVCAALACPQPKFLFRSAGDITITPQSWHFETDVFVDPMGDPLSDHDALAVRFRWDAVE